VSEGVKPLIDTVITFGAGHFYVSQSDKGGLVFGGDIDGYNSYAQRGGLPLVEHVMEEGVALIPMIGRLRVLRSWGGVMDMSMDGSPIIGTTPVDGLFLNAGWCYGGFKATPASGWCFAHTIATGEPHALNAAFSLDRFARGRAPTPRCTNPWIASDAHQLSPLRRAFGRGVHRSRAGRTCQATDLGRHRGLDRLCLCPEQSHGRA
jgi:heterotetrameric sarcosine oxidase beta subunit